MELNEFRFWKTKLDLRVKHEDDRFWKTKLDLCVKHEDDRLLSLSDLTPII
jgi:hypothetical protein